MKKILLPALSVVFGALGLVLRQLQLREDHLVALDDFRRGEADGKSGFLGVILDQVRDGMQTPVDGAALIIRSAEILPKRHFLVFCDMDRVADELVDALVFGG